MCSRTSRKRFIGTRPVPFDIQVRGQHIPGPVTSYSAVPVGRPLAIFGSSGHLEIAVRNGSAQKQLSLERGDSVKLHRKYRP